MAMVLNEEQVQLQDAAKKFLQKRSPVSALRKLRDEKNTDGIDRELWKEVAELGWAGILVEEDFGGLGLTPLWMGLINEECGRTLSATPLLSTAILGATLIQKLGNEDQKKNLLEPLAAGELITAFAIDEGPHHKPNKIKCSAKKQGSDFVLDGKKTFVFDGHIADKIIVAARTSGNDNDENGISLFIVDAKSAGLKITRSDMVDFHNAAELYFEQVKVAESDLLGTLDQAYQTISDTLDIANACLAAELLGASLEAFERVIEYLKTRTQFDVLIGSFQALQHRAAIMFSELELSKSAIRKALSDLDEQQQNSAQYVSLAKALINDTAQLVSNEGIQMFGGIGMTDEEDIGLFFKRIRVLMQSFGSSSYHKDRYAMLGGF
jgi:alkylation response protein AidB-like acyl-CoA dehydrogenase